VTGGAAPARAGRLFERRTLAVLRDAGYWALGSPGSHGPVDIVAIKAPHHVLFVQCKRHGLLPPQEWNVLFALAARIGAVPLLADRPGPGAGVRFRRLDNARAPGDHGRMPLSAYPLDLIAEARP
jgi:Holliday junction resolvase